MGAQVGEMKTVPMIRLKIAVGTTMAEVETAATEAATTALRIRFPETGLHPGAVVEYMQHLLHWLVANPTCEVVVLTMSEAVVNCVGRAVRRGSFQAEDVLIVGRDVDRSFQATVAPTGGLRGWPFGFLAPISHNDLYPQDSSRIER